jgi:hypothetical protein
MDLPFDLNPDGHDLEAPSGDIALIEAISDHFEPLFGEVGIVYHEIQSEYIHLDVYRFDPVDEGDGYTFVTCGLAERPMNAPLEIRDRENYLYAELILHLPADWPMEWEEFKKPENIWPVTTLKSFARLPHERESWIWGGHTLANGDGPEPYTAETELCAALLCPSFQLPEEFETLAMPDGRNIVFLTLAFLYREEWEFTKEHYSDAFFERIRSAGMGPREFYELDKNRRNLCQ